MATSTLNHNHHHNYDHNRNRNRPPLTIPFELFSSPYQTTQQLQLQQSYRDFGSPSLYSSPLDGFTTDFTAADSTASPDTPMSTTFANAYSLPQDGGEWMSALPPWDAKAEFSLSPDFLKAEDDEAVFGSCSSPMIGADDAVVFGREGMNDTQPLFQPLPTRSQQLCEPTPTTTAAPAATASLTSRPLPAAAAIETAQQPQSALDQPSASRYPSRSSRKRKTPSGTNAACTSTIPPSPPSTSPAASSSDERASQRSSSSPAPTAAASAAARRTSSSTTSSKQSRTGTGAAPKKTAHNMIEKRYRNNLNDKIAALRDAVPALRAAASSNRADGGDGPTSSEDEDEDTGGSATRRRGSGRRGRAADDHRGLGGIAPAQKLNKATILSKATEYIEHLERRNRDMAEENAALRTRVGGLEMIVMGKGGGSAAGGPSMWNV